MAETISDVQYRKLQVINAPFVGSLQDQLFKYYGTLSALAPIEDFSISDHQRVYWETQTGLIGRSLADLEKAFYDVQLIPAGSLADRELAYWNGLP